MVVAPKVVVVALVPKKVEAKSDVEVAFEVVAFSAVKFWSVVEEMTKRFGVVNIVPLRSERLPF